MGAHVVFAVAVLVVSRALQQSPSPRGRGEERRGEARTPRHRHTHTAHHHGGEDTHEHTTHDTGHCARGGNALSPWAESCVLCVLSVSCVCGVCQSASSPRRVHTALIGGGPCGLGAAWRLEELARQGVPLAEDWTLLEAAPTAGGLAGSVVDEKGFTSEQKRTGQRRGSTG
jgi:hypothetical protein